MTFALEDRLLILCARVTPGAEAIDAAASLLSHKLDWDYLVETSIRHAVAPLFYQGLKQVEQAVGLDLGVPPAVRHKLCELYRGSMARNTRLYRVIYEVAAAFDRDAIPLMGLKDVQLAWQVYPEVGLRPMGDIDLLIHPQDYHRAAACLADLGFAPQPGSDIPYTRKYAWAHHFLRAADNVWADVQWNVMQLEWDSCGEGNFDFEIERMWQGAVPMTIDGAALLVPRPEDMLFHLCLHLEGHQYAELVLFCDIAEMLRSYSSRLDWRYLVALARRYRVESSLYYTLWLVQHLFQVDVSPVLFKELAPAYFKAGIFEPLFGNLTSLHLALDELRLAARPPAAVMAEFEATARLQAAAAMQLYRELDSVTMGFIEQGARESVSCAPPDSGLNDTQDGGCLAILDGSPSERILPDLLLSPFDEIRLFLLDRDLQAFSRTLTEHGFTPVDSAGDGVSFRSRTAAYAKGWGIVSRDPALEGRPARMTVHVNLAVDLDVALQSLATEPRSKKEIALSVIKARISGQHGTRDVQARVTAIALPPEEMLVYLSARLGTREQSRLFGLTGLLEFFRRYTGPICWERVATIARHRDLSLAVHDGLAMAAELLDEVLPPTALAACTQGAPPPRVLELARYSASSLGLYTNLKAPFLYALCLLALRGPKARVQYLLRSLVGGDEHGAVLPRLAWQLGLGLLRHLRPADRPTITGMAYWVEPVPREVTVADRGESP